MNRTMIASINDRYHSFNGEDFNEDIKRFNNTLGEKSLVFYDLTHLNEKHPEMELDGGDVYFALYQSKYLSGVICQGKTIGNPYQRSNNSQAINIEMDVMLNTIMTPILSLDTIIAYLPHIPWNEFGEYIILNEQDSYTFNSLWMAHIRSIQPFIKEARNNYPHRCNELFFFRSDYIQDETK